MECSHWYSGQPTPCLVDTQVDCFLVSIIQSFFFFWKYWLLAHMFLGSWDLGYCVDDVDPHLTYVFACRWLMHVWRRQTPQFVGFLLWMKTNNNGDTPYCVTKSLLISVSCSWEVCVCPVPRSCTVTNCCKASHKTNIARPLSISRSTLDRFLCLESFFVCILIFFWHDHVDRRHCHLNLDLQVSVNKIQNCLILSAEHLLVKDIRHLGRCHETQFSAEAHSCACYSAGIRDFGLFYMTTIHTLHEEDCWDRVHNHPRNWDHVLVMVRPLFLNFNFHKPDGRSDPPHLVAFVQHHALCQWCVGHSKL